MNGDGFDDVVVGAWGASSAAGEVLVIFGSNMFPAVVTAENLNGTDGFVIRGATTSDASGFSVAPAGVSSSNERGAGTLSDRAALCLRRGCFTSNFLVGYAMVRRTLGCSPDHLATYGRL